MSNNNVHLEEGRGRWLHKFGTDINPAHVHGLFFFFFFNFVKNGFLVKLQISEQVKSMNFQPKSKTVLSRKLNALQGNSFERISLN